MTAIKEGSMGDDINKLSPTPRKSERERKHISYAKFVKGERETDEEDPILGDGMANKLKKVDSKKISTSEVHRKMQELFETMKQHEHADLFNKPLDQNHPLYNDIKAEYTTLSMLELSFKIGNTFKSTDEVANKFRNMIM